MKKLSAIIIAMALVLGLGQCKKQETPTANNEEDMVYITVNVDDDGAKHTVYPSTGAYVFTDGDVLYVGNNGHFIGTLEYQSGAFSGGIQSPSTDDYLHFYFLGGKGPQAPEAGTESFTIDIADQSDNLPVLSYGPSTQKYTDANATYTTTLKNKCALVEFTTNEIPVETAVSLSGMQTEASINFNDNTITPTSTTGSLTLHAESATSRWAILLPGEEVTATASAEGYNSSTVTVPAVSNNGYLAGTSAVSFGMTEAASSVSLATPLTLEALTDGTIKVNYQEGMQYSLNGGAKTVMDDNYSYYYTHIINVTAGDKVQFYGDGTNITAYGSEGGDSGRFGGTATVKVYGNIMSLVDETGFETATTLTGGYAFSYLFSDNDQLVDASGLLLPATTLSHDCYEYMFENCVNLTAAPELPATSLNDYCYCGMFAGCTSLTTAPALPATTLTDCCYANMFNGCTSLTTAPALPATELWYGCYLGMFRECTSLTTAPELPATTLSESCYYAMFENCTSLTTAPVLPATELRPNGWEVPYEYMFYGCSNLSTVTCLATSGTDGASTDHWLEGAGTNVTGTKTFYAAPSAEWPEGDDGIPSGWTRVDIQ